MEINEQLKSVDGAKDFIKNLSEECRKNIIEAVKFNPIEQKEKELLLLQGRILSKLHMKNNHQSWLQKRTDELLKSQDKEGLEQLHKGIDFTEKGGLIFHTIEYGDIKFTPKQATYNDIKRIPGIENRKNVRQYDEYLYANYEAILKIMDSGKKICTDHQFMAAINILPGGDCLTGYFRTVAHSTKVTDFFDLLGVEQFGKRNKQGNLCENEFRMLRCSTFNGISGDAIECYNNGNGRMGYGYRDQALGIWFIED